jgi:uncharacterized protein (UPF0210 family)
MKIKESVVLPSTRIPFLLLCTSLFVLGLSSFSVATDQKPSVRTITSFIKLDRSKLEVQVKETLLVLRGIRDTLKNEGYPVQTIRISTQPFPDYIHGLSNKDALLLFRRLDELAGKEGFLASIGCVSQVEYVEHLVLVLQQLSNLNVSLIVADEHGVRWNSVKQAAVLIKRLQETPGGSANFNFAASALIPPNSPFYPVSYQQGPDKQFAVGLQSANVVANVFDNAKNPITAQDGLIKELGKHASHIDTICKRLEVERGWTYVGLDLSPAPLGKVSIAAAIESLTGVSFGSPGTLSGAAVVTNALEVINVRKTGYCGLMIPVMEDETLADRWSEGTLSIHALLSYSSVCACGLDMIPLPGNVTAEQVEKIVGDVASLSVKHRKPLAIRLLPIPGKKAGDLCNFNHPAISNVRIQPVK